MQQQTYVLHAYITTNKVGNLEQIFLGGSGITGVQKLQEICGRDIRV
jgi:hypothetical protein